MQFMMKSDSNLIYESPNGGKTVYGRKPGTVEKHLVYEDPAFIKEQKIKQRWMNLKGAVFMAEEDTTLNDALNTVEILYKLKQNDE